MKCTTSERQKHWTNRVFSMLCIGIPLRDDETSELLRAGGFEANKGRVSSWRRKPDHKNYGKMPEEALWALLEGLIVERMEEEGKQFHPWPEVKKTAPPTFRGAAGPKR